MIEAAQAQQAASSATNYFEPNPILSLFDNDIISKVHLPTDSTLNAFAPGSETSAFFSARLELLMALPHEPDLVKLIDLSQDWWKLAPHRLPELFDLQTLTTGDWKSVLNRKLNLPNPAETAHVALWTIMSIERLPFSVFKDKTFRDPANVATFNSRVLPIIDKVVVLDDDVASSLSGIQCLVLLARYYCNRGKLQKAWHMCRRALEYSTSKRLNRPHLRSHNAGLSDEHRRERATWQAICFLDRYLSMVLGLPYGAQDILRDSTEGTEPTQHQTTPFQTSITSVMSEIIDRNQKSLSDSDFALSTMKIDQEMGIIMRLDTNAEQVSDSRIQDAYEHLEAYILKRFVRTLLHLPLMLKSLSQKDKGAFQHSYDTARESSRNALIAYKCIRDAFQLDPYLCTMLDFQAFTMTVLLILHLLGKLPSDGQPSTIQDEQDLEIIAEVSNIFRRASGDRRQNTIATQAVTIISLLLRFRHSDGGESMSCPRTNSQGGQPCQVKINLPCFGEIAISKGTQSPGCFCVSASADMLHSGFDMPTAQIQFPPEQETPIIQHPDFRPTLMDDPAAPFDGDWSALARNVASVFPANSIDGLRRQG